METPEGTYYIELSAQYDDIFTVPSDIEKAQIRLDVSAGEITAVFSTLSYPSAPEPRQLHVADMNNDNVLDFVIRSRPSANSPIGVSVLFGVGGDAYSDPITIDTQYFDSISIGDFNGDGGRDIATTEQSSGLISVLYGDGNDGFTRSDVGIFRAPHTLSVHDLDNDGYDDLLVSMQPYWPDSNVQAVSVFYGSFNGFSDPVSHDFGDFDSVRPLIIEDFNGDGIVDLLLQHGRIIDLMQGTGTRDFIAGVPLNFDGHTTQIAACLFDSDTYTDLITVKRAAILSSQGTSESVEVHLGNGSGFSKEATISVGPAGAPVAAELDGDGDCDVARVGRLANFLLGTGTGQFEGRMSYRMPVGSIVSETTAVDLDGDQRDEIVGLVVDSDAILIVKLQ